LDDLQCPVHQKIVYYDRRCTYTSINSISFHRPTCRNPFRQSDSPWCPYGFHPPTVPADTLPLSSLISEPIDADYSHNDPLFDDNVLQSSDHSVIDVQNDNVHYDGDYLDLPDLESGSTDDVDDSLPDLVSRSRSIHYDFDSASDDDNSLDADFDDELDGDANNKPVASLVAAPNTRSQAARTGFANSLAAFPNLKTRFANAIQTIRDDRLQSHHIRR
jgi:hypothetical protein